MAETRQERIERIALRDAERKTKEQSFIKKGLPTLGWMAGLALPGAGITDVAGLYPEDMSGGGVILLVWFLIVLFFSVLMLRLFVLLLVQRS